MTALRSTGWRYDWRNEYHQCDLCQVLVREGHTPEECLAWREKRPGPGAQPLFVRPELPEPPPVKRRR